MNDFATPLQNARLWQGILDHLVPEVAALTEGEKKWILLRLAEIGRLQEQLQSYFRKADGDRICSDCHGFCCDRGKNHITLVNLLAYLVLEETPPHPDFTRSCPFLGDRGCLFPVSRRPFNCITFLCEAIEDHLPQGERESFYQIERSLRARYEDFDRRYAGSSLRGIFIRAERLGTGAFLAPP